MNDQNFYITTPIYYVNDVPHIGHTYTTLLADVMAGYHRLAGHPTRFLTGTDEHGQKVESSAKKRNVAPQTHCDEMSQRFKDEWSKLEFQYDRFIRTTDPDHTAFVTAMLQKLWDNGEIYSAEYEGWYYVSDEIFITDAQVEEIRAKKPDAEIVRITEKNYFFRMSTHQDWLRAYIIENPQFVQPHFRANEVLGFLRQPLGDLCISRPKSRLTWGVELPFDPDYVCYVWVDALLNYVTGTQNAAENLTHDAIIERWNSHPADFHLIGKDILTTHCVYWPTILHALNLALPKTIFAHGWWLMGGEKMSKSVGNVIGPTELTEQCGSVDAMRYLLIRGMNPGQDATLTDERIKTIVNGELANDLGNLLSRTIALIQKFYDGVVPTDTTNQLFSDTPFSEYTGRILTNESQSEFTWRDGVKGSYTQVAGRFNSLATDESVDQIKTVSESLVYLSDMITKANMYFAINEPWKQAGIDKPYTAQVLRNCLDVLRITSIYLYPVMPAKMNELRATLALSPITSSSTFDQLVAEQLVTGAKLSLERGLFPRLDIKPEPVTAKPAKPAKPVVAAPVVATVAEGVITIDDVRKVELRVAKILSAQPVEGATKLLMLQVDDGNGENSPRQLIAGIAEYYSPDQLIGLSIVIVANLKPAKIKGVQSNGMLLAAKSDGKLTLLTIASEMPPGSSIG